MKINMRKTTRAEKAFLREVDERLKALGKPATERQRLKRKALQENRMERSTEEQRLTRGLAKQHVKESNKEYRKVVPAMEVES